MKVPINFILILLFGVFTKLAQTALPSFFPVCLRNDPDINSCVVRSINALQPRFASGDLGPGFKIPPAEPFYVPNVSYGSGSFFQSSFSNTYIRGISGLKVDKINVNINDLRFDMIISLPRLDYTADYRFYLFFGLPQYSNGNLHAIYDKVQVRVTLTAKKYLKNGTEYIKFNPVYFKIINYNIRDIKFSNLFDGSLFLGRIIRMFIQYDQQYLTSNVIPELEKVFSRLFTGIANQIADQASFDELFPN